jgi:hypothetical protein
MDQMTDYTEDELQAAREKLAAKVDSFGAALVSKRQEAITGRKNSGIEDEWTLAEESYQGVDDANRAENLGKPSGHNGGYINSAVRPAAGTRSTVYLNITRPYVDAAAAKVGDMLLPTDDRNWGISPTPVPAIAKVEESQELANTPMAQAILDLQAKAREACKGAERQIEDWLVECQWHAEFRKVIEDCARLGTGVLKGPFPTKRKSKAVKRIGGMTAMMMEERICPASQCINPWNFYPDPSCGEDIQDGSYCWEKDLISAKKLRELKGIPGYLSWQIDKVLEEGPGGKHKTETFAPGKVKAQDDDQFEIWYFHGTASREDLEAAGVEIPGDQMLAVPCLVIMVNDCVIRAALTPMDDGEYPYDVMPWQRKPNMPWGTGIAIQINTPQRMINAGARNMMDNAGYSAGPQIAMRRDAVEPADGTWQITPRKIWFIKEGADVNAVQQAIVAINIPTMQQELLNIIQFALKMAEDVTGLPMIMQGQTGQQGRAAETVGGMQMLNNNASVVLRRIARLADDRVTERHIRRYYRWLMEFHDDDSIKGDFQIDARGSTALVERDLQNQTILGMAEMVLNPAFEVDPKKWFSEFLKSQRLDPERFQMDKEKLAEVQAAAAQQPQAPQIAAAQIRAETELQKTQMLLQAKAQESQQEAELRMMQAQSEYDRDTAYVQAENQRTQIEHEAKMQELMLKRELAMLDYANKREMTLEQVKADLAKESMRINSVKELAAMKASADMMPKPPVEPAGRAQNGMSYQQ